jgi:outer membrane immunogenic protein
MKRVAIALLTSAALAVGLSQVASAADLGVRAAPPPPPPAPAPTWTGLYIGVNGGGAWQSTPTWNFTDPTGTLASQSLTGTNVFGAVGGLQAGYNYQFFPGWLGFSSWVIGVEGDIDWTSLQAQTTSTLARPNGVLLPQSSLMMSQNERWLASVRGKLGFTWWGNTLWYGTGGVAWANTEYSAQALVGPFTAVQNFQSNTSNTTTNLGWVAGGGAEWQATTNILLRVEYLYYRFNNSNQNSSAAFFTGPGTTIPTAVAPLGYSWSSYNVQVARVAVSYKF